MKSWERFHCGVLSFSFSFECCIAVFPNIYIKSVNSIKRQVEEADLPLNWPHTACWQVVMASCPWNVFLYIFFFMCTNTRRLQIPVCQYETDWAEIREGFWDRRCWVRGYIYTDKHWERDTCRLDVDLCAVPALRACIVFLVFITSNWHHTVF